MPLTPPGMAMSVTTAVERSTLALQHGQRLDAIVGRDDPIAGLLDRIDRHHPHEDVVLDHENRGARLTPWECGPAAWQGDSRCAASTPSAAAAC